MTADRTPRSEKELWQSLASGRDVAARPVDAAEFAAWIEGRLTESQAAAVEAAVAADPELRRAALEIADIIGHSLPPAPERMVVRARALVGFEAERTARGGWFEQWFFSGPRHGVQRAAVTMAALVIAAGGFAMGGGLGASFAHERLGVSNDQAMRASADTSSEIGEFLTSDRI